jgi:hypothetical protein
VKGTLSISSQQLERPETVTVAPACVGPDHITALAALTAGERWQKAFFAGTRWG